MDINDKDENKASNMDFFKHILNCFVLVLMYNL